MSHLVSSIVCNRMPSDLVEISMPTGFFWDLAQRLNKFWKSSAGTLTASCGYGMRRICGKCT
eukprot:3861156-Amphidinium_carterae.1